MAGKDFQKGMEAGAKPYEAKYQQYAEALDRLKEEFNRNWGTAKGVIDEVLEHLDSRQKKELFGSNTQFDIKNLTDLQKDILVATLYTLSRDHSNEEQQGYIRSVQKYLDIKNPPTNADFSAIEGLDNNASRAIFQACVEYLYLAKENPEFFGEYDDDLFCHFNVSPKARLALWENVVHIFLATGKQGLVEKYGYVPESTEEDGDGFDISNMEEITIETFMHIPAGVEKKFYAQKIHFNADIHCEGKLVFDHCIVRYNSTSKNGKIRSDVGLDVSFISCKIIDLNCEKDNMFGSLTLFMSTNRRSNLNCKNSVFENCYAFTHNSKVIMNDCIVRYTAKGPSNVAFISANSESTIENCLFECTEGSRTGNGKYECLLNNFGSIKNCTFKNIICTMESVTQAKNCLFVGCKGVFFKKYSDESLNLTGCLFLNCKNSISCGKAQIKYCKFIGCTSVLIYVSTEDTVEIKYCEFYNMDRDCKGIHISVRPKFIGLFKERFPDVKISDCIFDGMHQKAYPDGLGFISCELDKGLSQFKKRIIVLYVENCSFKHCVTEGETKIISTKNCKGSPYADETVVVVSNCTGLENVNKEGDKADTIPVRMETASGEPIGARLDNAMVGVPGL